MEKKRIKYLPFAILLNIIIAFTSCSIEEDYNNDTPIGDSEKKDVILSKDYIKGADTFLYSNGVAMSVATDSVGNEMCYRIFIDSLDFNNNEWVEEKALIVYCDSNYRPIYAGNLNGNLMQFFYSDKNTFSVTIFREGNEIAELPDIQMPDDFTVKVRAARDASVSDINTALSVLGLLQDAMTTNDMALALDIGSILVPEALPELVSENWSGLVNEGASLFLSYLGTHFSKAVSGYIGLMLTGIETVNAAKDWVVREYIGDITPKITFIELEGQSSVNIRVEFEGSGFASNMKEAPFYRIIYWKEQNGVLIEEYKTDSKVAKYGFNIDNIPLNSTGVYAFQVIVYPGLFENLDFLMRYYSYHSNIARIKIPPLYLTYLEQDHNYKATYKDGAVVASIKAAIDYQSEQDEVVLSYYNDYGIYIKNGDRELDLYSAKENGGNEYNITLHVPKESFTLNYNDYIAISDDIRIGVYTIDGYGIREYYDERTLQVIYDERPSITLQNVQLISTGPYSDNDKWDTKSNYVFSYELAGSLFIDGLYYSSFGTFWDTQFNREIRNYSDGLNRYGSGILYNWGDTYLSTYYGIYAIVNGKEIAPNNYMKFLGNANCIMVNSINVANSYSRSISTDGIMPSMNIDE